MATLTFSAASTTIPRNFMGLIGHLADAEYDGHGLTSISYVSALAGHPLIRVLSNDYTGSPLTGFTSGTVTGMVWDYPGSILEIAGLNLPLADLAAHIDSGDVAAMASLILAGDDIMNGSTRTDRMIGGAGADQLNGNGGRDVLYGGDGDDSISGGMGRDVLTGGEGSDTFVFSLHRPADRIRDWQSVDSLGLDNAWAPSLGPDGIIDIRKFHVGSAAETGDHRIIHDPITGRILFDMDGDGDRPASVVAHLGIGVGVTVDDILIL